MCEVLLAHQTEWLSEFELKALAANRINDLKQQGAPIKIKSKASEAVLSAAMSMLLGRGFVEKRDTDQLIRPRPESIDILKYYANSIVQWNRDN
jgi:hypothetical protein